MIEVSVRCPCGTNLVVDVSAAFTTTDGWSCHCPDCYDPSPEPSSASTCLAYGKTPEAAVAACWAMIEEAWEIDYLPVTLFADLSEQAGDEAERQEGWKNKYTFTPLRPGTSVCMYGPEVSP